MEKKDGWKTLEDRTLKFKKDLETSLAERDLMMTTYASLFWIHQRVDGTIRKIEQIPSRQKETFKSFFESCLVEGVYLAPHAFEVGFMSLAHTEDVLREAGQRIEKALAAVDRVRS